MNTFKLKDGKTVTYRRINSNDIKALQEFDRGLSEESRRRFSPHAYDDTTMVKVAARSENDDDRVYAAWDDNIIIAYFFLWWFKDDFPILGIGIADNWQGKGLGKQIMNKLIEDGKSSGRKGIELTTMLDNKKAFALYEKVGFKCLGKVDNITGDGRHVVEWHMVYPITAEGENPPPRKHEPPI